MKSPNLIDVLALREAADRRLRYHDGIMSSMWHRRKPALESFYRSALPEIVAVGPHEWGINPYEIDWTMLFTHIEANMWADIRSSWLIMYPQFPARGYFLDFANPVARVAIECDGKAFHMDKAKDAARDAHLAQDGWVVYRITGADCNKDGEDGALSPGAALVDRICQAHSLGRYRLSGESQARIGQ